jgi:hypothetical protein
VNTKKFTSVLAILCLQRWFEGKKHRKVKAPRRSNATVPTVFHDETGVGIHRVECWRPSVSPLQVVGESLEQIWSGPLGLRVVARKAIERMCNMPSRLGRTRQQARCDRSLPHDGSYSRGVVQEVQHCDRVSK